MRFAFLVFSFLFVFPDPVFNVLLVAFVLGVLALCVYAVCVARRRKKEKAAAEKQRRPSWAETSEFKKWIAENEKAEKTLWESAPDLALSVLPPDILTAEAEQYLLSRSKNNEVASTTAQNGSREEQEKQKRNKAVQGG